MIIPVPRGHMSSQRFDVGGAVIDSGDPVIFGIVRARSGAATNGGVAIAGTVLSAIGPQPRRPGAATSWSTRSPVPGRRTTSPTPRNGGSGDITCKITKNGPSAVVTCSGT